ncbi:type IV secretion system DNA-binding domain-containing protein [uncultured Anaeromusa sp.]|uniref:type IV secretory system conjugative DNA transfer family protein n=1 Tax=uncultured Anaeromusa sp. TaxID=673273 RepID=UPI0029C97561|nr:type IV secretion system DNA-binding domain-containing protein [uncultured Anaeromusa sp.]
MSSEAWHTNGMDYIVRRPARAVAVGGSVALMVLCWPQSWVMIFSGWMVYKVLHVQRGGLYKLGEARFFLMGCLALLSPLLAMMVPHSIGSWPSGITINLSGYIHNSEYQALVNAFLVEYSDDIFRWRLGLLYSLAYGIGLYLFCVEGDNRTIRRTDIAGMQVTPDQLKASAGDWKIVFMIAVGIVLSFYALPLAVLYAGVVVGLGLLPALGKKMLSVLGVGILSYALLSVWSLETFLEIPTVTRDLLIAGNITELFTLHLLQSSHTKSSLIILAGAVVVHTVVVWSEKEVSSKKETSEEEGSWIGTNEITKLPVVLPDRELNQHLLILGSTGAGKTTTILTMVDSALSRRIPVVMLDGKGSRDLPDKLRVLCKKYNRRLRVFALEPKGIPEINAYNPFWSGTHTEWKNRVMALFSGNAEGRGQEHYALAEENYLNLLCDTLRKTEKEIDLRTVLAYLERPDEFIKLAQRVNSGMVPKIEAAVQANTEGSLSMDTAKQLELFIYSAYGNLLDTRKQETIRLKEAIKEGDCVLFMFNASSYPIDTKRVAKMVISDINGSFSELANENGYTKTFCIFDEFASYASSNLADTISLHRSNGMHAIIGTQSIATVALKSPETKRIAQELVACCNTYIVQAIGHLDDVEMLAKIIGTRKTYEVTTQINAMEGGATGMGASKFVDEFVVNPQSIRELKTGEGYLYRKAAVTRQSAEKVRFRCIL